MAEPPAAEPRSDDDAVLDDSPSAIATTAARALALGASLTRPEALQGLNQDLEAIGIRRAPLPWGGWSRRLKIVEESDAVLARYNLLNEVREREAYGWVANQDGESGPERVVRLDLWHDLATRSSSRGAAVAWLRMLMTDREPVAAAAAAAGLSHWVARKDMQVPVPLSSARKALEHYGESSSPGARQIARAARGDSSPVRRLPSTNVEAEVPAGSISTLVHGTGAYTGDWWFVGGDFHSYIKSDVRCDLFSGRNAFWWSGKYDEKHRAVAARRLAGWAEDTASGFLNTVFGHSYGGIIALNATTYGLTMRELVLLSVPAEDVPVEWRRIGRSVSLRIHLDLVLLAARRRQRFAQNVDEHYIDRWFWNHADSHDPDIWQDEDCARILGL